MDAKEDECAEHRARTEMIQCQLLDPNTGIAVKIARIETHLEHQGEKTGEILDSVKWLFRGIVTILITIVGFVAQQTYTTVQAAKKPVYDPWNAGAGPSMNVASTSASSDKETQKKGIKK